MMTLIISLGAVAFLTLLIMYLNWRENKQAKNDKINEINKLPPKGME